MKDKKLIIGLVIIGLFILAYFGFDKFDEISLDNKKNDYPKESQIFEDSLFRLEDIRYEGKLIFNEIKKEDIKMSDLKKNLDDNYLEYTFTLLIPHKDITIEAPFSAYYRFKNDKWMHDGSVIDKKEVVYPSECKENLARKYLENNYYDGKITLKNSNRDKYNNCIFDFDVDYELYTDKVKVRHYIAEDFADLNYTYVNEFSVEEKETEYKN